MQPNNMSQEDTVSWAGHARQQHEPGGHGLLSRSLPKGKAAALQPTGYVPICAPINRASCSSLPNHWGSKSSCTSSHFTIPPYRSLLSHGFD